MALDPKDPEFFQRLILDDAGAGAQMYSPVVTTGRSPECVIM
jgi:hypothetical protein